MSAGVGLGVVSGVRPAAGLLDPPFRHGIASGDPTADAVIIWTRLTPTPEAVPGSGIGPVVDVVWEVATDPDFTGVVAQGTVPVGPSTDHTLHVDVTGLAAGHRPLVPVPVLGLDVAGGTDPHRPGRRRRPSMPSASGSSRAPSGSSACSAPTAAWPNATTSTWSCTSATTSTSSASATGRWRRPGQRTHEPEHEIVSLADYRTRYAQYHGDAGTLALHAAHPMICMYDDHEIANDTWREGAENHNPGDEGDFAEPGRASPARRGASGCPCASTPTDPEVVHRRFRVRRPRRPVDARRASLPRRPARVGAVQPRLGRPRDQRPVTHHARSRPTRLAARRHGGVGGVLEGGGQPGAVHPPERRTRAHRRRQGSCSARSPRTCR